MSASRPLRRLLWVVPAAITVPSGTAGTMTPLGTQPVLQLVDASDSPIAIAGQTVTAIAHHGVGVVYSGGSVTTDATERRCSRR